MLSNKDVIDKDSLDQAGRRLVEESGLTASEVHSIASSPYLYAKLRANIRAELGKQDDSTLWFALSRTSRRAIPVMGLAAAFSFGLFLYVNRSKPVSQPFSVDAYLGAGESGFDNMLFAERRPLTVDEVLTTIIRDDREAAR
jgi:hypothetical protein